MSKHPIDDIFKKRFENHEVEVPEHIWTNVGRAIAKEPTKTKNRLFWLPWASLAAALLVGMWFLLYDGSGDSKLKQNNSSSGRIAISEKRESVLHSADRQNTVQKRDLNDDVNTLTSGSKEDGNTIEQEEFKQEKEGQSLELNHASDHEGLQAHGLRAAVSTDKYFGSTTSDDREQERMYAGNTNSLSLSLSESNGNSFESMKKVTDISRSSFSVLTGLENDDDRVKSISSMYEQSVNIGNEPPRVRGKKNAIRLRWSVGLNYGYDFVQRSFRAKSPEFLGIAQYRTENEVLNNAFTLGFEVAARWRKWSIITGLHLSQVNDRYDYIIDDSEQNMGGTMVQGTLRKSVVNRYQSYEIPIIAEYSWGYDRLRMGAIVGANFGLNYEVSGEVFDDATLMVRPLNSQGEYVSQMGIVPVVGMMMGYQVGYNGLLFVRPTFKYYSSSLTEDSYGLDHAQATTSFLFGYRHLIN